MDVTAIINEILYIISTYEKGKNCCGKQYKKQQRKLFLESLSVMELLVDYLSAPEKEQSKEKQLSVVKFINKNTNIIFPESEKMEAVNNNRFNLDFNIIDLNSEERKVIELMQIIIQKCKTEKNPKSVFCLLMAFHNLPRVFFESNTTPLFNCTVNPITSKDALELADIWLEKVTTH